jgi:hypothetical protein
LLFGHLTAALSTTLTALSAALAATLATLAAACAARTTLTALRLEGLNLGDLLLREVEILSDVAAHQQGHWGHLSAASLAKATATLTTSAALSLASALSKCKRGDREK